MSSIVTRRLKKYKRRKDYAAATKSVTFMTWSLRYHRYFHRRYGPANPLQIEYKNEPKSSLRRTT